MQNAQVRTANHERLRLTVPSYLLSPNFEENIRTQLNQILLTENEMNACALATD